MSDKYSPDLLEGLEIVVIDDDENSLDVASIVLEFAGADITIASDGRQGLDAVHRVKPALILCDISMPVMDGWEFIRLLKSDPLHNTTPTIALTAHAMVGDEEKVLTAGFDGYLTKPLDPIKFANQLLGVLEKAEVQFS